jgi:hypothetical protein
LLRERHPKLQAGFLLHDVDALAAANGLKVRPPHFYEIAAALPGIGAKYDDTGNVVACTGVAQFNLLIRPWPAPVTAANNLSSCSNFTREQVAHHSEALDCLQGDLGIGLRAGFIGQAIQEALNKGWPDHANLQGRCPACPLD